MKIGLDLDGVIYNFTKVYNAKLIELGHHDVILEEEPDTWDYFIQYGYTMDEFRAHMDELVDSKRLFWTGDLYEESIPENIRQLRKAGHTIHIVTNRFSGKILCPEQGTRHFLDSKGIEYDSLTFSPDKTVIKTDVFLEDNLKNFEALWSADIICYLINRPYNQTGKDEDEGFRVDSFQEFSTLWLPGNVWWDHSEFLGRQASARIR